MNPLFSAVLTTALVFAATSSPANTRETTYEQTRDWVVSTVTEFAGYTRQNTVIVYKEVSMDACKLRFSTLATSPDGYADTETFVVSLDSVKNVLWGTVSNPSRGYVLFTTASPINFSKRRVWSLIGHPPQVTTAATTIASIEFGKPGTDYADTANQMKVALLRAADLCKLQLAAK